jgi:hypothetical protein
MVFHRPQRLARPIATDLAAQAMLNGVPLRAAGRIVTHRHPQVQPVTKLALELGFPHPGATPITAPTICQDQEGRAPGVPHTPAVLPPLPDRRDGKLRGVRRHADIDCPLMVLQGAAGRRCRTAPRAPARRPGSRAR